MSTTRYGLVGPEQLAATAAWLARTQGCDGGFAWDHRGRLDVWDHLEVCMALSSWGYVDDSRAGLEFAAACAYPADSPCAGLVPHRFDSGEVTEDCADTNHSAYLATAVWTHLVATDDEQFARRLWPAVVRACEAVAALIDVNGHVPWAITSAGQPATECLLTGASSIHRSLLCASDLARMLDEPEPDIGAATKRLGTRIAGGDHGFADRSRYSMDWYYPVLSGALPLGAARARLAAGRERFTEDLGVRCVADRPWVTTAETCELAMAHAAVGDTTTAWRLWSSVQHLRSIDGSYWTGYVLDDDALWPDEQSTWSAAAVLLAYDMLAPRDALRRTVSRLFQIDAT